MVIRFFKYKGLPNVLNKQVVVIGEVEGSLMTPLNLISPTITIRNTIENVNNLDYCYIDALQRYYFVENATYELANKLTLELNLDVLYTYKDFILNSFATSTVSENANLFTSQASTPYDIRANVKRIDSINAIDKFNPKGTLLMITMKGK